MQASRNALAAWAATGALVALSLAFPAAASPESLTAAYCAAGVSSGLRPLPSRLVGPAALALGVDAKMLKSGASFRCSGGKLLVCAVGANLWCGKADTNAKPRSVIVYCRRNPSAALAPMAVTGHATIYSWRCERGVPKIAATPRAVDSDGYLADNWRALD
jgi:hypothetical protein